MRQVHLVAQAFCSRYKSLCQSGLITREMLQRYETANDASLHSRLQSALMLAGYDAGMVAFPEIKLRLKEPLDKYAISAKLVKQRYQRTLQVDIGYTQTSNYAALAKSTRWTWHITRHHKSLR